jgi:hypothetical protein
MGFALNIQIKQEILKSESLGLVDWLKVKALNSNTCTAKKKNKESHKYFKLKRK